MSYCVDCGTRKAGGICPNCQEELYILTYQSEDFAMSEVDKDFMEKATRQRDELVKRGEQG